MGAEETRYVHCNECGQSTKHTKLYQNEVASPPSPYPDDEGVYSIKTHTLVQCNGCDAITFEVSRWFSEDEGTSQTYYPPRTARKKPNWLDKLPHDYLPLLNEVYAALDGGSRILAMMGARTVLDMFIHRKVGDCGNFKQGLDELVAQNFLAEMNRATIESAIEAGNAAAHRAYNPSPSVLGAVMDIVENLIQYDVLAASAEELKGEIPARQRKENQATKGAQQ